MKSNKPHSLTPSKSNPLPTRLLFLDTETDVRPLDQDRKVHKLKLGVIWDVRRNGESELEQQAELVFETQETLYSWLKRLLVGNQTFYLIAHNIAYDAMIVDAFRQLPKLGFKMESLYSKAQVTIIRWKKGKTSLIMLDNGNLFSGTLERWGSIFKVPKLDIDFDNCTMEELTVYCRRDVEIMYRSWSVWFQFLIDHDCGGFRVTVGSTAFNTWRHAYMPEDIYVHKNSKALRLERDAYHGGRVECFFQGKLNSSNYYYLDINNMYGFVMKTGKYPVGLQGYSTRLPIRRLITYLERYSVIANVRVNVDMPAFVTKVNGFTAYPLGRFDVSLTTNELILALQNGWLEEIYALAWYRSDTIFSEYVSDFYNLRMNYRAIENNGFEQICKLLINSLYGKFGQTGLRQVVLGETSPDEIWSSFVINADTGQNSRQVAIGGTVYEEFKEGESFHAMPAIAAHVTANARLYLLRLINIAGWENTFYTDTDSLIVNQSGYDRLEHLIAENELGKLKIEVKSDHVEILAAKEYIIEDRKRFKGIRANAIEIEPGLFTQEQWPKLAGMIRAGMPMDYITKTIEKRQLRRIRSGVVLPSGWVEPFVLR